MRFRIYFLIHGVSVIQGRNHKMIGVFSLIFRVLITGLWLFANRRRVLKKKKKKSK